MQALINIATNVSYGTGWLVWVLLALTVPYGRLILWSALACTGGVLIHCWRYLILTGGRYDTAFFSREWLYLKPVFIYIVLFMVLELVKLTFYASFVALDVFSMCLESTLGPEAGPVILSEASLFPSIVYGAGSLLQLEFDSTTHGVGTVAFAVYLSVIIRLSHVVDLVIHYGYFLLRKIHSSIMKNFESTRAPLKYNPLLAGQMRLLKIERRLPFLPLRLTLFTTDQEAAPAYEAISYSWGTYIDRCDIVVNEESHSTSVSTYDALLGVSSYWRSRIVWVDAICINQADMQEKALQVRQMIDFYRNAERVIVHLGSPALAACVLFQIHDILAMNARGASSSDMYRWYSQLRMIPSWEWFMDFFNHPWFSRVWVIQEVAVAKQVDFFYGGLLIDWATFENLTQLFLEPNMTALVQQTDIGIRAKESIIKFRRVRRVRENTQDQRDFPANSANMLYLKLTNPAKAGEMIARLQILSLAELLKSHQSFNATDPRDMIYALQGLAIETVAPELLPDYERSTEDLYIAFARRLWGGRNPFCLIPAAGVGFQRRLNLPSWVPDWTCDPEAMPLSDPGYDEWVPTGYQARGDTSPVVVCQTSSDHSIHVKGLVVDEIVAMASYLENLSSDSEYVVDRHGTMLVPSDWIRSYEQQVEIWTMVLSEQVSGSLHERSDACWRTMIGDRTEDDRPAPASTSLDFAHWFKMIEKMMPYAQARGALDLPNDPDHLQDREAMQTWNRLSGPSSIGRRFAITKHGRMGLVPYKAEIGDQVFLALGANTPWLIRPKTREDVSEGEPADVVEVENEMPGDGVRQTEPSPPKDYLLVGECYIHGIMDGELMNDSRADYIRLV